MRMKELVSKVLFIDLIKGLSVTFKAMVSHAVTEQYPKERSKIYERFRGEPRMAVDENGNTKCIACNLCALNCPVGCITVESERNPETKKKVLTRYVFDMQRCLFCGFCEEICPVDCIQLTMDYEMSQYDRKNFILELEALEKGMEKIKYKK